MKILKSKVFVGFICFLVGAVSVLAAQRVITERQRSLSLSKSKLQVKNGGPTDIDSALNDFDNFFDNDDFFSLAHDPFQQMRQMQKRMMKDFNEPSLGVGRFGAGDVAEIKKREDKDFVYYDIGIKGIDKKNLNFKIADGQINISGRTENKSEENGSGTYVSSSFHRSFPVPPDVDGKRVQVEEDQDRVTLKFPRVTATS